MSGIQVWEWQSHRGSSSKAFSLAQPSLYYSVTWFWQQFQPGFPHAVLPLRALFHPDTRGCFPAASDPPGQGPGRAEKGQKGSVCGSPRRWRRGWRDGGGGPQDQLPARCHGDAPAQPIGGRGGGGCAVLGRHPVGARGNGTDTDILSAGRTPASPGPEHRLDPARPRLPASAAGPKPRALTHGRTLRPPR